MTERKIAYPPDFFILGGMKCGTTSLFNYLSQHPGVISPEEKELHYYDIHKYLGQTLEQYLARFPARENPAVQEKTILTGEATPFYTTHPHCPEWIQQDFPQAKFIVVMRNPVERFWSQYNQMKRYRHYDGSPEDVIAFELAHGEREWMRLLENPQHPVSDLKMCSILRRGCYFEQLERWFRYFNEDRFLLLFTENLLNDRAGVVSQVFEFLGLEPFADLQLDTLHHTQHYSKMSSSLKLTLEDYYAPHNSRLADYPGLQLPWK